MSPTAAHIHEAAPGVNGPVIVPLAKSSDTTFTVPANAKLTDAEYAAYKAGNLYVNGTAPPTRAVKFAPSSRAVDALSTA